MSDVGIDPGKTYSVIWALGQELPYVHRPNSGIESGRASDTEFYKLDEPKYHGRGGRGQRGSTRIEFIGNQNVQ